MFDSINEIRYHTSMIRSFHSREEDRIFNREYDVAMDLNLDFVLHTAYICKASRARVRVGYSHSAADLFYNVQLNFDRNSSPQVLYKKFASCLAMF